MKKNFTLIELLIVIAIIAILAGILLPALNRAHLAANTTKCTANLKQCTTALFLYADSFSDIIPVRIDKKNWGVLLKDTKLLSPSPVLECPIQTGGQRPNFSSNGDGLWFTYAGFSTWGIVGKEKIKMENELGTFSNYNTEVRFNRMSRMKKTSSTILMADARKNVTTGQEMNYTFSYYPDSDVAAFIWLGHGEKATVAFADGAAKSLTQNGFSDMPFSTKLLKANRTFITFTK